MPVSHKRQQAGGAPSRAAPSVFLFSTNGTYNRQTSDAGNTINPSTKSGQVHDVALELVASGGRDPTRAAALGRAYYGLASESIAFKPTKPIVRGAIEERLGGPALDPFVTMSPEQRERARAYLLGETPVTKMIAGDRNTIQSWLDSVNESATEARALALAEGEDGMEGKPISELLADLWKDKIASAWARGRAEDNGLLDRVAEAGLTGEDLLAIPTIGAAVGVMLGLAVAQAVKGRKPRFGDYRDSQHCMLAASAGAVFVTNDGRLTEIAEAIPGQPVTVMTLAALLERIRTNG